MSVTYKYELGVLDPEAEHLGVGSVVSIEVNSRACPAVYRFHRDRRSDSYSTEYLHRAHISQTFATYHHLLESPNRHLPSQHPAFLLPGPHRLLSSLHQSNPLVQLDSGHPKGYRSQSH